MDMPICDFVRKYADSESLRLHMPGHKGRGFLGPELLDITEINGADSLYEADGIISASEKNASKLFGCHTFFSTEGSSQCIRAMLYLALQNARVKTERPFVLAGRNAHKTFLSAAALLDFDVQWLYPLSGESYLSCSAAELEKELADTKNHPIAVYLTSPDYLGNMVDIQKAAEICHKYDVLLLVDNAHGAYLRFLPESLHPCDLGADMCCSSAHKTLPVLTGGAYLHIRSDDAAKKAKMAMSLFGSTSPSYLILQSLDAANCYLADYREKLLEFLPQIDNLKENLLAYGYQLIGHEVLKITIAPKNLGYTGYALADYLEQRGIVCEFADPDYLVLMLTPELSDVDLERLERLLLEVPILKPILEQPPHMSCPERIMSVRNAILSDCEEIQIDAGVNRVLASASVGCPPAVPILACGERIDENVVEAFRYYGIKTCFVVKK